MGVTAGRALRAAFVLFSMLVAVAAASAAIPVPKLTAHVMDSTGTLEPAKREALEAKLKDFEARRGSQVVVLMVPTLGDETIEEFAGRVTDEWKLGRKGVDDGVLFVIAKQDRKLRIHTGRGVQGTLTDALSKRIVSDIVAPRFREGDFAGGVDAGVDAIMKAVEGEDLPLPQARPQSQGKVDTVSSLGNFAVLAFFGVPILAGILRSMFGRFFGAGITSAITGVGAWLLLGSIAIGVVAALIAFVMTLFMGLGGARVVGPGGWGGGISPGGWGGGSWGGGGGGGGFSGGGGGFDGGGASGRW